MPNHAEQLAKELNLSLKNVQGAIDLIDAGNTIPFIARYRKEATGSMDDQVLRNLGDRRKTCADRISVKKKLNCRLKRRTP